MTRERPHGNSEPHRNLVRAVAHGRGWSRAVSADVRRKCLATRSFACLAWSEVVRPRQDSNLGTRFRKPMLYPLSYGGGAGAIGGRKPPRQAARIGGAGCRVALWALPAACQPVDGVHGRFRRAQVPGLAGNSRVYAASGSARCRWWRCSASELTVSTKPRRLRCWRGVANAVGAAEPHGVVEVPVDGLGVVAAGKQPFEVGITGRDGPEVLGPVQLPRRVLVIAVQPDRDGLLLVLGGQLVVVVPAEAASLVPVAVRAEAGEWHEARLAGVGELADAEHTTRREEPKCARRAVRERDGLVFDVNVLLDPPLVPSRLLRAGLRRAHPFAVGLANEEIARAYLDWFRTTRRRTPVTGYGTVALVREQPRVSAIVRVRVQIVWASSLNADAMRR